MSDEFVEKLMKQAADENPTVRKSAVESLGRMNAKNALPRLVEMMEGDTDPSVRAAAMEAATTLKLSSEPTTDSPSGKKTFLG